MTIAQNRAKILQFPALKGLISDVFMAFLMRNMPLCEKSSVQKIAIDFQKRGVSKRKIDYFETKTNKTLTLYVSDLSVLYDARHLFFLVSKLPAKNIRLSS